MIKRILIAFAVIVVMASVAPAEDKPYGTYDGDTYAPFEIYGFSKGQSDDYALKVDGKKTVRWPFQYEWLTICKIPLKMEIGMFIRVKDCDKASLILHQVDCDDINKDDDEWPCYEGCLLVDGKRDELKVTSNFDAELRAKVDRVGDVLKKDKYSASVTPDEVSAGSSVEVDVCVKAWEVQIEKGEPGDKEDVGFVLLQARPQL